LNGCWHITRLLSGAITLLLAVTSAAGVPHLEKQGTAERLIVNNTPMLLLAGELGNSRARNFQTGRAWTFFLRLRRLRATLIRGHSRPCLRI
jgi:hypothetical protein